MRQAFLFDFVDTGEGSGDKAHATVNAWITFLDEEVDSTPPALAVAESFARASLQSYSTEAVRPFPHHQGSPPFFT